MDNVEPIEGITAAEMDALMKTLIFGEWDDEEDDDYHVCDGCESVFASYELNHCDLCADAFCDDCINTHANLHLPDSHIVPYREIP